MSDQDDQEQYKTHPEIGPPPRMDPVFAGLIGLTAFTGVIAAAYTGEVLWLIVGLCMSLTIYIVAIVEGLPQTERFRVYPRAIRLVMGVMLALVVGVLAWMYL